MKSLTSQKECSHYLSKSLLKLINGESLKPDKTKEMTEEIDGQTVKVVEIK